MSNSLTPAVTHSFEIAASSRSIAKVGGDNPLLLIAGPCVIENRDHTMRHAEAVIKTAEKVGVPIIFKSSFDKANRTSKDGFRGQGMEEGLKILDEVRSQFGTPVITDVHNEAQAAQAAEYVDVLQVPAFLCRQTDLLLAVAATEKPVMVKKGQFLAPEDMQYVAAKLKTGGTDKIMLCERGTCFGYRELIVDFRGLKVMADTGYPVIFDATHSVQVMGGAGGKSSGNRQYVADLARAAVAVGVSGVFLECHEDPENAPSDGPNMLPLPALEAVVSDLKFLHEASLVTRRTTATV